MVLKIIPGRENEICISCHRKDVNANELMIDEHNGQTLCFGLCSRCLAQMHIELTSFMMKKMEGEHE